MAKKRRSKNPNPITATAAGETVASIDDILIEILLRLPLKPLIRSKLVCKHWRSLIASHNFCLLRNPAPNPCRGLFFWLKRRCSRNRYNSYRYYYIPLYPDSYDPSINFNFTLSPAKTMILNSCNGLLLCCSSKTWNDVVPVMNESDCELYVYNPTTKYYTILPHLPSESPLGACSTKSGATLVFDPVKSPHYKVVLAVNVNYSGHYLIQIYSSQTGVWSYGGEIRYPRSSVRLDDGGGVYWKGSIHWLRRKCSPEKSEPSLRYDVETQVFDEMPTPPLVGKQSYMDNFYFGESSGHLHFMEHVLPRFNIYEMKSDYSEWFVKYQVDLVLPLASYPEAIRVDDYIHQEHYIGYAAALIREDGENSVLVLRIHGKILKYNLVDGTLEKLVDIDQGNLNMSYGTGMDGENVKYWYDNEYGSAYIQSLYNV